MDQLVRDPVWTQLDPLAGRLSRRSIGRLRLSAVLVLLLVLGGVAVWMSGLIMPRLGWPGSTGWGASASPSEITVELQVANRGWTAADIVGAGRSGPGLRLTAVTGAFPATLAPGHAMTIRLVYRVTDCAAVTASSWPVPVRVRRPWGTVTVYIQVPELDRPGISSGAHSYTGPDPYAVQWQRGLADESCSALGRS